MAMTTQVSHQQPETGMLDFAERALVDFGLLEVYLDRPEEERAACMRWLRASRSGSDEEDRVSRLLDCLDAGVTLPGG